MAAATRLGDMGGIHDACPSVPLVTASGDVFINGKGAGRVGDSYQIHWCGVHPPHTPIISSGSSTVFINGRQSARIGDSTDCGGVVVEGSENVWVGD